VTDEGVVRFLNAAKTLSAGMISHGNNEAKVVKLPKTITIRSSFNCQLDARTLSLRSSLCRRQTSCEPMNEDKITLRPVEQSADWFEQKCILYILPRQHGSNDARTCTTLDSTDVRRCSFVKLVLHTSQTFKAQQECTNCKNTGEHGLNVIKLS
jgi:hypothetical protein